MKRPAIPEQIKREVRQRCGFGCIICGLPVYEYEHMKEWAKVKRHIASEITLLCDNHHKAKTTKRMPSFIVEEANKNPYNLRQKLSTSDILYYSGQNATIKMGESSFILTDNGKGAAMSPIKIGNFSLINILLQDQHFLLSMYLFDNNNNIILAIQNNEMKYCLDIWDIEYIGRRLIIRQSSRNIYIDIIFETPNVINFIRGQFYFNGNKFKITKEGLIINDKINISRTSIHNCNVGIQL